MGRKWDPVLTFGLDAPVEPWALKVLYINHPILLDFLCRRMNGENRPLVTDEPVEFETFNQLKFKTLFSKIITSRCRGIYRIYLKSIKVSTKISQLGELGRNH